MTRTPSGLLPVLSLLVLGSAAALRADGEKIQVWRTTSDFSSQLTPQSDLSYAPDAGGTQVTIAVDDTKRFQTMDGFGVSLTDSSCYLLSTKLTDAKRAQVMTSLFGEAGIGMSMIRQPMGSCDFNRVMYSYAETAGDTALAHFSVVKDDEVMVPMIKQAMALNPQLKIMSSPWSPPGWMKTTGSMIGGSLKVENYGTMADYFVKYVQAYADRGIPIYAITPQNEPGYASDRYPGCLYSGSAQMTFIRDYLAPALKTANLSPKILCYDHNYDGYSIPLSILANKAARDVLAGSAFHHYGGDPSAMTTLHGFFPDKDIWFTEGGIGDWNNTFDNIAHEMISIPRNWAKSIIYWNAALDPDDLPALIGINNTNQGMVTIRSDTQDVVTYNPQYYYMGHLSKFVKPGAVHIDSPNWDGTIETVAFQNTDGSYVLVVFNKQVTQATVKLSWHTLSTQAVLSAKSLTTFRWRPLPQIQKAPVATKGVSGTSVSLQVEAADTTGVTYQWYRNGLALSGATEPILALYQCQAGDAGDYTVTLTNSSGAVTSTPVALTVDPQTAVAGPNDRLSNLSTRSFVSTGGSVQIAGFVVRGDTPKKVLIRANGPALALFKLTGLLADPVLELFSGQTSIAKNDDWDPALKQSFADAGAFGWTEGSPDAALVATLPPGDYTAQVSGKNGGTGTALVEVYDMDPSTTTSRLVNLSTRSEVDTGSNVQIAGFAITADAPKKILVRASGPALSPFLSGYLQDPLLQIYSGQTLLFANDSWASTLQADFDAAHAFAWPSGSPDAAMVLTLPAGNYTAVVSGKGSDVGVGLVEVYEVP